ncbi:hypothetical protein RR48_01308 [Papilio machaon]|uniref:Uncharacterized protein n=1 Tax=Papilio machaon TaxID=76193 RepID=A0A0N1PKK9_PAPMA|nr:hypothetical protein RR48_01308 [Papilio machaon]
MDPCKTPKKKTSKEKAKNPCQIKKPFFENILDRFRSKQEKNWQTTGKKKSKINFEKRIAKLENLIKKLQNEICELSTNAETSLKEMQMANRASADTPYLTVQGSGASAYSCTQCQVKTVAVKDINFTREDIEKITNKIPELQNLFDFEESCCSSESRNNTSEDMDKDDYENIMEEEVDKLIYELKSEIRNKLGPTKGSGPKITASNDEME